MEKLELQMTKSACAELEACSCAVYLQREGLCGMSRLLLVGDPL
jgi:hypothetical protein